MDKITFPIAMIFSIISTVSGLIAIYVKLKSDVVKIETEQKHEKERQTVILKSIEKLTDKVEEFNSKYTNLLIELAIKQSNK